MKKLATGVFVSKVCKNFRASAAFARDLGPAASALFVAPRSKVILALLLIVGAIPIWAQNGTGGPQPPSGAPTAPAGTQQTEDRPVSLKLVVPNILQDQKPIWTFPAKAVKGKHWKPMLAIAGATAGLVALDTIDAPYFRRTSAFNQFNKNFSGTNMGVGMAVVPLSLYAISLVRKNAYGQHTSLLAGEAVADAEILTAVMKHVDRRLRPSDVPPYGDYDDTWFRAPETLSARQSSFPSGHTIAAFAVATVLADRYRNHRWAPWVAYGLAGLVGFSRISLSAHFPSDVFAGAALGYLISHYVVLRNH